MCSIETHFLSYKPKVRVALVSPEPHSPAAFTDFGANVSLPAFLRSYRECARIGVQF